MYILKKVRLDKKMTVREMAGFLQVSISCIYNYEKERRHPSDELVYRFIDKFKSIGIELKFEDLRPRTNCF